MSRTQYFPVSKALDLGQNGFAMPSVKRKRPNHAPAQKTRREPAHVEPIIAGWGSLWRAARKLTHLSQEELGRRAGQNKGTVQMFESGKRAPTLRSLFPMADVLRTEFEARRLDDRPLKKCLTLPSPKSFNNTSQTFDEDDTSMVESRNPKGTTGNPEYEGEGTSPMVNVRERAANFARWLVDNLADLSSLDTYRELEKDIRSQVEAAVEQDMQRRGKG